MKVLFVDTNLFIQCKELSQLPWETISKDENILLLISRPVQEQIDNLKYDSNKRRAKRAKETNHLFSEILDSSKTIRDSNPKVQIAFAPSVNIKKHQLPEIIGRSSADDLIIAETLIYKKEHPKEDVTILTHDTGPILTAKRCDLFPIKIPKDWLLPPEPDERDKRIIELERKIKEMEQSYPEIEVVIKDVNQNLLVNLPIQVVCYSNLTDLEMENFLTLVKSKYPMTTEFGKQKKESVPSKLIDLGVLTGMQPRYDPPNEQVIKRYKEELYPQWVQKVGEFFKLLPQKLEWPSRNIDILIAISNMGNVPAENVLVEFILQGGILIIAPSDDNNNNEILNNDYKLPKPPIPPKGRTVTTNELLFPPIIPNVATLMPSYDDILNYKSLLNSPLKRDRHAFYWKNGKPIELEASWIFECDEFRHQVEPETFKMTLFVPPSDTIEKGVLKCRITAKNLPKPIKKILPIKVTYNQGNTVEQAYSFLEKSIE